MKHLRTSQISNEELETILTEDRLEKLKERYTKSPYLGDFTPEEVVVHRIDLLRNCLKQSSEALEEYNLFLDWYMEIENYSVAVILTITHKAHMTECEISKFEKELAELLQDAKLMGVEVIN